VPPSPRFEALRKELHGAQKTTGEPCLSFGAAPIDHHLPGGGLAPGLHEVCPAGGDLPHEAAATQMLAYLLGRGKGQVIWTLSKRFLFAPGLAETGLTHDRVIYAEAGCEADILAVGEEALRHGGLCGVVIESHRLSLKASRRLQLAAESSGTPCFALRLWKRDMPPLSGTAALTRWQVGVRPSRHPSGLPRPAWHLELTRCRGGQPRAWSVDLDLKQGETGTYRFAATAKPCAASSDLEEASLVG
jgi:protein ImuA